MKTDRKRNLWGIDGSCEIILWGLVYFIEIYLWGLNNFAIFAP